MKLTSRQHTISDLILLVNDDVSEGEESDTWTTEGEEVGRGGFGGGRWPIRVTWMGMVTWREVREEGVRGVVVGLLGEEGVEAEDWGGGDGGGIGGGGDD
ncbi:hypothetical protein Tco_1071311 [Tanacetum coccineum]